MAKKKLKELCLCNIKRPQKIKEENRTRQEMRLPSENLEVTEIDEMDEPESYPDIVELSVADFFSPASQNTPRQAPAPEGSRKHACGSHSDRNSERTIRRHKKTKRDLEAQGFFTLQEFFKQKAESARQEEPTETVQSEDTTAEENKTCKGDEDMVNEDVHKGEVTKSVCNMDSGAVSVSVLEVGDMAKSAEEDDAAGSLHSAKGAMTTIWFEEEEEEEEEETNAEDEAKTTGGAISVHRLSSSDLILYESEELSSSSSCGGDLSEPEDLNDTDTKELTGIHHRNTPDDATTQQPVLKCKDAGKARGTITQDQKHQS
ncbi:hypothetical protein EDB85DRAFT_1894489 [Lactarius pseudohatsudake]|nr:hypothetical protein EDB85DRAFT_1894489 [Lactarius pseudohatsudake]